MLKPGRAAALNSGLAMFVVGGATNHTNGPTSKPQVFDLQDC